MSRAYRRHQEAKRKKKMRDTLHAIWPRRSDITKNLYADHRRPQEWYKDTIITDKIIAKHAKTSIQKTCKCSWCCPPYNKRLRRHIDSHGTFGDKASVVSDPWYGM